MHGKDATSAVHTPSTIAIDLGMEAGAGARARLNGELADGYYIQPTLFKGHNKMRIFHEEIF